MVSINTNLQSLIVQQNLTQSTNALNLAIERMTTGFKINHAADNAAGYSIAQNMSSKISSYQVAEDNASMGLDLLQTASDSLDLVSNHLNRIRDLAEQAANGTYGTDSLSAIQSEVDARMAEINRIISNTEYNGIQLLEGGSGSGGVTGSFIAEVEQLTEDEAIAQGYTVIKTADELQAMEDNLSGKYILMNDIDLQGYDWEEVGNAWNNTFTGELNGNGHVIKNLTSDSGIFGYLNTGANINNLGITNVNINCSAAFGGIANSASNSVSVTNCYVTGTILYRGDNVGGLIGLSEGMMAGTPTIDSCYADVTITGEGDRVGGLVGDGSFEGVIIQNSFATGSVNGTNYIGGLYGGNDNYHVKIENSYSLCEVTGTGTNVGGIAGRVQGGMVTNTYWDTEISGQNTAFEADSAVTVTNVLGKTTSELNAMISAGTLVSPRPADSNNSITMQVGINGDSSSQISVNTGFSFGLSVNVSSHSSAISALSAIDEQLKAVSSKQTEIGAAQNRLESVLESISVSYENLVSSRSTLRDADIATESSSYIKAQILQQASATLLATANQSPSIALQLI